MLKLDPSLKPLTVKVVNFPRPRRMVLNVVMASNARKYDPEVLSSLPC